MNEKILFKYRDNSEIKLISADSLEVLLKFISDNYSVNKNQVKFNKIPEGYAVMLTNKVNQSFACIGVVNINPYEINNR